MTTLARRNSSIHKIREFQLDKIQLEDEYDVIHVLQEGWRGRLLLVEHRRTRHEVVIKAIHRDSSSRLDFFREFHYNYYLSPHLNILNAYDVAFEVGEYYAFAQEYAPFGDLTTNMSDIGLGEINTKKIALQLASALDFMHSKDLVHRDINMDNVLVFKSDFSHVKLCDFGATRKKGTLLKKRTVWLPYAPPEIVDAVQNEGFHADTTQDVWQLGILIYVLLTGQLPWQKADATDPNYSEYISWRKRRILRTPKRFTNFTSRFLRMVKRLLEPKAEKRASVKEVYKYMDDKWLLKLPRRDAGDVDGQSVCYSTFSMHSCPQEKDRILGALKAHGIETTVDRIAKRQRIHEWLERSLSSKTLGELEEPTKDECQESECRGRRRIRNQQKDENRSSLDESTRKQYQEFASMAVKVAQAKAARLVQDANHNTTPDARIRDGHELQQPGSAAGQTRQQQHETGELMIRPQQHLHQPQKTQPPPPPPPQHIQQQQQKIQQPQPPPLQHPQQQQHQKQPQQQHQHQPVNTVVGDRTKYIQPQQRPTPPQQSSRRSSSTEESRGTATPFQQQQQQQDSQWHREAPHRSSTRGSRRSGGGGRSGSGSPHVRSPPVVPVEVVGSPLFNRKSGGSVKETRSTGGSVKDTRRGGSVKEVKKRDEMERAAREADRGGREVSKERIWEALRDEGKEGSTLGDRAGDKEGPITTITTTTTSSTIDKTREMPRDATGPDHVHRLPNHPGTPKEPPQAPSQSITSYDLQRSKTDSFFVTGTTRSPPSTQTSCDSESSDTSLVSVQPLMIR